jgi:hypothetical protein
MKRLSNMLMIPLLVLLAVLATVIAAVKLTDDQARAAQRKLTAQQTQMREAETRVQKSGAEKELIARYLPDYQKLEALGFIGDEQRINWLDALRNANHKGGLFGINYDLAARQAYPHAALLTPGQMNIMQTIMKLRLPMLHEEDLQKFFVNLAEQNTGVFLVDQCTLRRTGATQTSRFQPNMTAECQLAWITAQPVTALAAEPSQ